jgi:hypothetical protein
MGLLNFLSFHKWSVYLTEDTSSAVVGIFCCLCVLLVVKLFANMQMDGKNCYYNVKSKTSFVGRLLNIFLYIVLLSIVSLFNSSTTFIVMELLLITYIIIVGIICDANNDCDQYSSPENEFIVDLEHKYEVYVKESTAKKQNINNVNKRIHDYKKRAIIG